MKHAIVLTALAFLAGCSGTDDAATDEYVEGRLLEIWLIGSWGDNGNCAAPIHMLGDGTFENADGSSGRWTLDGDRLTLSGKADSIEVTVTRDSEDAMTLTHSDGSVGHSIRCPSED